MDVARESVDDSADCLSEWSEKEKVRTLTELTVSTTFSPPSKRWIGHGRWLKGTPYVPRNYYPLREDPFSRLLFLADLFLHNNRE
jgi:hypothetical protein